jgi:hypothetical protein
MKFQWLGIALPLALVACGSKSDASAKADKDDASKSEKRSHHGDKNKDEKDKDGKAAAEKSAKPADAAGAKDDEALKAGDGAHPDKADESAADGKAQPAADAAKATSLPEYSFDKIKKLDDSCTNAWVILSNAPASVGADYDWKWSTQAFLANLEFHTTAGDPAAQWQVGFEVRQFDASMANAYVLLAHCADGYTCNRVAAMYTAAVHSSHPQLFCGNPPANLGARIKRVDLTAGGWDANKPASGDAISLCARLAACHAYANPAATDDIGSACQKGPANFKLDCARQSVCSEVDACLGK